MTRRLHEGLALAGLVLALSTAGCQRQVELQPVPEANVNGFEQAVQKKVAQAKAEFERIEATKPGRRELGNAYGELAMTYHAQDLLKSAEVAYDNARKLAPKELRWPYLQGHMYNDSGRQVEAIRVFESAYEIDGNDLPLLISLGQVYLQHGDIDKAQRMFEKALPTKEGRAAAETGLAKVAMSKRDYKEAVRHFEEALKLWPSATRLRQPLSVAYRALGDTAKAEENVARFDISGLEPTIPDAAADALGAKAAASRVLLRRGQREGKAGRFDLAEGAFRAAFEADPNNAEALANLGISLANLGRTAEAQQALVQSVKMDDTIGVAHLSLAVIYDRQGNDPSAKQHYERALQIEPENVQAAAYLADLEMRGGHADKAIELYERALKPTPDSARMRFSLAMAYVKARRFPDASKSLESIVGGDQTGEVTNVLARVLATAPEATVRDGPRALKLAQALFEKTKSPEVGQTYAMALAENGKFAEAATLQKETMIVYERMKAQVDTEFLTRNLQQYQKQQPTREGWSAGDPLLMPRSPAATLEKPKAVS